MPPKKDGGPAPKKKKGLYKLPDPLPKGLKVVDNQKKEWEIGESIGTGGFAEVYSAKESNKETASKNAIKYPFAIKVEPKENGPLFCEIHFYMRATKPELIAEWKKTKKVKHCGVSPFYSSGLFTFKNTEYRFLVTDRYGKSLYNIISENDKQIPTDTVHQIAIQLLDMLEYIHSKGYIHGDIKAANLLFGVKPGTEKYLHLVDYGLAKKFKSDVEDLPRDPKLAGNGTIEYISRDGHNGVFGTRGDLEMLAFNLLHWINSTLPWEKDIANAAVVQQKKEELMASPSTYINKNLPKVPTVMVKFLDYINSIDNNQPIDFDLCRKLFLTELTKLKLKPYDELNFHVTKDSSVDSKVKKSASSKKQVKEEVVEEAEHYVGRRTRNSMSAAAASEPVEIKDSQSEQKGRTKSEADKENSKTQKPPAKKPAAKKEPKKTASWKDSQTIRASNIVKPGEYVSTRQAAPSKRK
ncbi:serine/threonine-protein kinase VRK1 [Nilaparvata lugens]|uniref:serine/threonine-protein kinase VRK1 n=1 Tax=Nilaparvata lugens TaxID=108931 RepID=UPI00193DDD6B|nr:serine/threonine-protein kinase VRK1 [Nilaparvata lugens]XP_022185416.2 serine/threonine-protein kinase VRK1 [Nilaparvata lugens]